MLSFSEWIKHRTTAVAIGIAIVLLVFTLYNPDWWSDKALGVLVGALLTAVVFPLLIFLLEKIKANTGVLGPWVLLLVTFGSAIFVRRFDGYYLVWPIQFHTPATPSPQSLLLILVGIFTLILSLGFVRALAKGEGVTVESNWGGLGGGLGGFRLSTPLIYLLGIFFLLVITSAIAWKVFGPPPAPAGQPTTQPSPAPSP